MAYVSLQQQQQQFLGNKPLTTGGAPGSTPGISSGYVPLSQQQQAFIKQAPQPKQQVTSKPLIASAQTPSTAKGGIKDKLIAWRDKTFDTPKIQAGINYFIDDAKKDNAHRYKFADTINQYTPHGFAGKATAFAAGMAQSTLNMPQDAIRGALNIGVTEARGKSTPKQVAGDLAAAAQLPLLFWTAGTSSLAKAGLSQTIKNVAASKLRDAGIAIADAAFTGAKFGLLGGFQSGKEITNTKDYLKNLWENVKVGALTAGGLAGITHVVLPLAAGMTTKAGSVFVKNIEKNPTIEHMQIDPKNARSMVIGNDLEKTPAGKEIIKQSVIAEEQGKQVAITPSTDGKFTLPGGQKVVIETAPIYEPSSKVSDKIIARTDKSTDIPIDDLVSVKNEPRESIDRAHQYISDAEAGKIAARKPITAIKLESGKYLITDGNATYNALKEKGVTHIPVQLEDMGKVEGVKLTDEQIAQAAKDHYQADAGKRKYGQVIQDVADKLGLSKVGKKGVADVKSITGILEKRHKRGAEVKDALRDTIIIKHPEDAQKVVDEFRARGYTGEQFNSERRVNGFKNRYTDNVPGYKDANYQFTKDGQTVEVQIMQKNMYDAKQLIGHDLYDLTDKAGATEKLNPEQKKAVELLKERANKLYEDAYLLDNPNNLREAGSEASVNKDGIISAGNPPEIFSKPSITSIKGALNTLREASSASLSSAVEKVASTVDAIENPSNKSVAKEVSKSNSQHTSEKPSVGTGKLKESRAYKRLVDHLEETDPETFAKVKDDPKLMYNTVNQKFDFENAAKIVQDNPDQAYRIAKQMEQAPVGQRWESVNIVLADRALTEKNYGLWKDLEQFRSLQQTRAGQGIVAERGRFNDNSPHTYVQKVLDERLKKIGRGFVTTGIDNAMKAVGKVSNSAKEAAIAKIDRVVEKAQKFTAKERTKINFAQKLLDDLTCK